VGCPNLIHGTSKKTTKGSQKITYHEYLSPPTVERLGWSTAAMSKVAREGGRVGGLENGLWVVVVVVVVFRETGGSGVGVMGVGREGFRGFMCVCVCVCV